MKETIMIPKGFSVAEMEIKLAILQARVRAGVECRDSYQGAD